MNLTAMRPKRHTRAPYRGGRHGHGVHPATRRVDLRMATIETQRPASITHLDGVPWYLAPIPPAVHECWPQSQHANADGVLWLDRCPCGAARIHHPAASAWLERDSRATGRVLSPTVIRLAAAQAHRRATQHERQAVVTGDRQVIQCSYNGSTHIAPPSSRAYIVHINPATGNDRIAVLIRCHNGRWAQKWESISNLSDFRVTVLPPGHAHHEDQRLCTFTDEEAQKFLGSISTPPAPRANVAAAMARVHSGGAR